MDKGVEHRGDNADEIDRETREQMVGLDEVREDEEDWFMPMHPTGSKNFKNLAIEAQKVMKRVYSYSPDARSSLRKQMTGLGTVLLEADKLVWGGDAGWLNAQFQ